MKRLNQKGITIVELIIYMGLSMAMMVVLGELFVAILDENLKAQNYSEVQTDGRYVLSRLRSQIGQVTASTDILEPANLGDSSPQLRIRVNGVIYTYHVSNSPAGTPVLYENDGTADSLISQPDTGIANAAFTRTGNAGGSPIILIVFTSSSGMPGTKNYESQTFKGAGGLRVKYVPI